MVVRNGMHLNLSQVRGGEGRQALPGRLAVGSFQRLGSLPRDQGTVDGGGADRELD